MNKTAVSDVSIYIAFILAYECRSQTNVKQADSIFAHPNAIQNSTCDDKYKHIACTTALKSEVKLK